MHEISVESSLLQDNQAVANRNREIFKEKGIYVLNLMSGPGAGKTSLLEVMLEQLSHNYRFAVIEGDVQSSADVERIKKIGTSAVQINTGGACHLDARMIHNVLSKFDLDSVDALIIENVGNLVCPAEFDLGEVDKVLLLSVTEGDDKPQKYPVIFHVAKAVLITKADLLPYVDFDLHGVKKNINALNIDAPIFTLSVKTGQGIEEWIAWIRNRIQRVRNLCQ